MTPRNRCICLTRCSFASAAQSRSPTLGNKIGTAKPWALHPSLSSNLWATTFWCSESIVVAAPPSAPIIKSRFACLITRLRTNLTGTASCSAAFASSARDQERAVASEAPSGSLLTTNSIQSHSDGNSRWNGTSVAVQAMLLSDWMNGRNESDRTPYSSSAPMLRLNC